MGILASRSRSAGEAMSANHNNLHAYRFPPKQGSFFANYFIMGGERFEVQQPESYLFGDNSDLNFLGSKPVPFPYSAPQANEPTKTLKALINIRKESVKFVRIPPSTSSDEPAYTIEFVFDCDVSCSITIYFMCVEEGATASQGVRFVPRQSGIVQPETFSYKPGASQVFSQPSVQWKPPVELLSYLHPQPVIYNAVGQTVLGTMFGDYCHPSDNDVFPVVIYCQAEEGNEPRQSQTTYCSIDRTSDGSFTLKPLKQKLFIDGLAYLLQDIYGIENKHVYCNKDSQDRLESGDEEEYIEASADEEGDEDKDDDEEDGGGECVICMSEPRDTLILPCRHLCLCQPCADSLRYQANNCPICRSPFKALLQIRALRKLAPPMSDYSHLGDGTPFGFQAISLLEALNGPTGSVNRRLARARQQQCRVKTLEMPTSESCKTEEDIHSPEDATLGANNAQDVTIKDLTSEDTDIFHDPVEPSAGVNGATVEAVNPQSVATVWAANNCPSLSRSQKGRRSLGAIPNENLTTGTPPIGPNSGLRRTRSAHSRQPLTNPRVSALGPRGTTSPSLRSSGDSCSSADSTRRLVKPISPNLPTNL